VISRWRITRHCRSTDRSFIIETLDKSECSGATEIMQRPVAQFQRSETARVPVSCASTSCTIDDRGTRPAKRVPLEKTLRELHPSFERTKQSGAKRATCDTTARDVACRRVVRTGRGSSRLSEYSDSQTPEPFVVERIRDKLATTPWH